MQGSGLLGESIKLPGVACAGAADLYDGRHTLAREIAGATLPVTRRYQQLLDDKTIDCIVAAVPDHWHRRIVVDAVSAGKDIYCEKPMSHTAADGVAMVDAVKPTKRIVQIGSQRVSSQICAKARELIAQGAIGELMMVEGSLGRNDPTGAWEYPPPPDLSPRTLDWDTWQRDVPKRALEPNIFARCGKPTRSNGTGRTTQNWASACRSPKPPHSPHPTLMVPGCICGISSRPCGPGSRWSRTWCSAIMRRWPATWRTSPTFGAAR